MLPASCDDASRNNRGFKTRRSLLSICWYISAAYMIGITRGLVFVMSPTSNNSNNYILGPASAAPPAAAVSVTPLVPFVVAASAASSV